MGRKRKTKKFNKTTFSVIYGIILIIIGISGIGSFGWLGSIFCATSAFFFGEIYYVPLALCVLIGTYIIFAKELSGITILYPNIVTDVFFKP